MAELKQTKRLKKEINLTGVFAIATGTTLSAGFFLLPGLAAAQAGPAVVIAYLIAAIPMIPAMFSIIELATAMPRAGGMYYFMDRTLGPMFGTIGGIGTFLALILKVAFALVGMGAYIALFFPTVPIIPIAILIAILLGLLNLYGAKKTGGFQIALVIGLLSILFLFIGEGIPQIDFANFKNFWGAGTDTIIATAGLVYISYVGITKVASLSEEVSDPEKNLPKGVILSLTVAIIIYVLGVGVMVGIIPMEQLSNSLTPVANAGEILLGDWGKIILSIAALFSFISVANAGTLSASRYPLAMSRDHIFPTIFRRLSKFGTPSFSILFTVVIIIVVLLFLDPLKIAKLASVFQLLMFALGCFAVIIMRESKIESYDPGFKSPFYPWMQIVGIIFPIYLIIEMGLMPSLFSLGLIVIGVIWYRTYARSRVIRTGAIYHIFERLGQKRYAGLDTELRGILKEKGLRKDDPFDEIVMRSIVLDLEEPSDFETVVEMASKRLRKIIPLTEEKITALIMEGTRVGATPVTHGVALPHFRANGIEQSEMVLLRCKPGVTIKTYDPLSHKEEEEQVVTAIFFLVSPEDNPTMHLRILAQIAGRVDDENFAADWNEAKDEQEIKEALLHDEKFYSLCIESETSTNHLIDQPIKDITIPEGCLIALIRRGGEVIIPKGSTIFREGDRLTIIGDKKGLEELKKKYN